MGRAKDSPSEPAASEMPEEATARVESATEPFVAPQVDQAAQVEEHLSPLEAIQRYARSKWDVQRLAYIRGIAVAAAVAGWRASRSLLPLLRELVSLPDTAVRQALASQLTPMAKSWAEDGGESGYTDAMELLDLGLHLIGDESEEVAQAGRDAVLGMAAILVPADVPRLLAALDELACFPDEDVRQSVVIMLAGLTGLLSARNCTDLLLPRIMKLLEDNAYLVRKECATALAEMAASVTPDACEDLCVKGIVTLSKDRVWAVRVAAAAAVPSIAVGAEPQTRAGVLRERMEVLVADVSKWVRPVARHSLGPFLATLTSEHISEDLLKHFTDTAGAKGEDAVALQIACACHLAQVTAAVGPDRWPLLQPALHTQASAAEAATRAALAGNLHRLAEVLPSQMAGEVLLPTTEALINDSEPMVQQALAKNCVDLLAALPEESRLTLFQQMSTVVAASGCAWRIRLALADQLGTIALLFDIKSVEEVVVKTAIQLCKDPVAVVRVAAADQMGQLLASAEEGGRQRAVILSKSLKFLSSEPVFKWRQVYIYMCYRLIGLVDPEFFQQQFIGDLLHLERDAVPNVRMALARMLAAADLTNLPDAVEVLQRLSKDHDRDTAQYAQAAEAVAHQPSQQQLEQAAGAHSPTRQRSIGTPRRKRSASLNLDDPQMFRWQAEAQAQAGLSGSMPDGGLGPVSAFADAAQGPPRRAGTALQQMAAAEAIAQYGKHSQAAGAASSGTSEDIDSQADPSTGRSEAGDSPAGGVEYEKGTSREAAKGLPLNQTMQHGKSQHIHVSAPLAAQDPPDSRRPHGSPEGGEALTGVNMIAAGQSGDALAGGTAEVEKTLQRLNALSIRTSPTFSDTRSKSL